MTEENSTNQENAGLRELIENQPRLAGWLGAGLIILMTFLAYIPAIRGGYIWDDDHHVYNNTLLMSWAGLGRIWTDVLPHPADYPLPQYYPLTHTTFWIEYHLWGLNPMGYHAVNVGLHVINALLVWLLLKKLNVPGAWLAAAIFALHPMNVESVAWISERKNCLSLLFFLSSLYVYLRYAKVIPAPAKANWLALPEDPQRIYALAAVLFLCALFSKTVADSMPAAALLIIWWKRGRLTVQDILPALPLLAVGMAMGGLTAYMEQVRVGVALRPQYWHYASTPLGEFGARCIIAGQALWFYVGKLIFPYPLIFNYPRWQIHVSDPVQYLWPASALAVMVILALNRKWRGALVAVLFYAGTLFPALGFIDLWPMQYSFVADHFAYVSLIGLIALASALVVKNLTLEGTAGAAVCVLLLFLGMTWTHSTVFQTMAPRKNPPSLWEDVLDKTNQTSWMAANNYGLALLDSGYLDLAERFFHLVIKLKPDHPEARYNLARVAEIRGSLAEMEQAATTQPSTRAVVSPTTLPTTRPAEYYEQAVNYYLEAIQYDPNYIDAHYFLARRLLAMGRNDQAVEQLKKTVEIYPHHHEALALLGDVMMKMDKPREAIGYLRRLAELEPESPRVHAALGLAMLQTGNMLDGLVEWNTALQMAPNDAALPNEFGVRMAAAGEFARARVFFARALQIDPQSVEAMTNLGVVAARLGFPTEARTLFEQALKLDPNFALAREKLADLASGKLAPATTRSTTLPATRPATAESVQ